MTEPLYTTEILRLAASLSEPRELDRIDGWAELRSPTCGSRISTAVQLDGERRIEAVSQWVHACAFGQASAALMGAHVLGRSPAELAEARDALAAWLDGTRDDPGAWPRLDVLAPARRLTARHGAILLPFQAVAEAAALAARAAVRP